MTRLVLRRGAVASVDRPGPLARIQVEIAGELRPAIAYTGLTGPIEPGDEVVVNCAALDLGLGSGGFDVVHVNLTRGLDAEGEPGAHVMKLNYTPLQHAVRPFEERAPEGAPLRGGGPVAVIGLHGQLPCVAWAASRAHEDVRIGYVQTSGGALPGPLSDVVRELRARGLLAGHVTAGPGVRGRGGRDHGGRGPARRLRRRGLGCRDRRARAGHPRLGHHARPRRARRARLRPRGARAQLAHPAGPAHVRGGPARRATAASRTTPPACSSCCSRRCSCRSRRGADSELAPVPEPHESAEYDVDLPGYAASGLPIRTMGRSSEEDELFFRAALAGGEALAREINGL